MREIIPLHKHPACKLAYHVLVRSIRIVQADGRPDKVNIYQTADGYVLECFNRWALSGFFGSDREAAEAWREHEPLLATKVTS